MIPRAVLSRPFFRFTEKVTVIIIALTTFRAVVEAPVLPSYF